jgi:hypothetical protein
MKPVCTLYARPNLSIHGLPSFVVFFISIIAASAKAMRLPTGPFYSSVLFDAQIPNQDLV